ncbi:unnamed protein product [Rhodiola kirilowii]
MEKEAREVKSKNKLMKYLPRAASALTFQNPRVSPGREAKPRHSDAYRNRAHAAQTAAQNRAFSGPWHLWSPKISCIGQIKEKKKLNKLKREKSKKLEKVKKSQAKTEDKGAKNKPISGLGNIFRAKKHVGIGGEDGGESGAAAARVESDEEECYSDDDEQRRDWDDDDDEEGGRSDVMIPFSAPMMIGGGNLLRRGVNGRVVCKVSYSVKDGDCVDCTISELQPLRAEPEDIPLDIVYEDDHVLVVNKAAHMVVHPAPGNPTGTLVNGILHHFAGRVDVPIGRDPNNRIRMIAAAGQGNVGHMRHAASRYKVIEVLVGGAFALVEWRLETGRTHQIRAHAKYLGIPLLGDEALPPCFGSRFQAPTHWGNVETLSPTTSGLRKNTGVS